MVPVAVRTSISRKFELLRSTLTERARRLWAGAEADALGYGGVAAVAAATGMAISTVRKGRDEVRADAGSVVVVRDRRPGAGRRKLEEKDPALTKELEKLVAPGERGDPEAPLRWTLKSTRVLAAELTEGGHPVSAQKVSELLHEAGYSLQGTSRVKEGASHPDRNEQFEVINERSKVFMERGVPVISVDSKKKESVGDYANTGREWQPKGQAVEVLTYDFFTEDGRRAIPYGIYDVAANTGFVNVGVDHDTPQFAVRSIETWWGSMGVARYPGATEIFITADGGGSNSTRSHVWKTELQSFADRHGLIVHVSHFPPGTSKWNKIEHRLFSFITLNWRGRPLTTYETVVALIGATTTSKGLRVESVLDEGTYPLGVRAKKHILAGLALERDAFHGDWNYTLRPRTAARIAEASKEPPPKPIVRDEWRRILAEQEASGMNPHRFCKVHGMNYVTFIYRRALLRGRVYQRKRAASPA